MISLDLPYLPRKVPHAPEDRGQASTFFAGIGPRVGPLEPEAASGVFPFSAKLPHRREEWKERWVHARS